MSVENQNYTIMLAKVEWYNELLLLEPHSKLFLPYARQLAELGTLENNQNRFEEALNVLKKGLEVHTEYMEARLFLIELLHQSGKKDKCGGEVARLASLFLSYPDFWDAWKEYAIDENENKDFSVALGFMGAFIKNKSLTILDIFEAGLSNLSPDKITDKNIKNQIVETLYNVNTKNIDVVEQIENIEDISEDIVEENLEDIVEENSENISESISNVVIEEEIPSEDNEIIEDIVETSVEFEDMGANNSLKEEESFEPIAEVDEQESFEPVAEVDEQESIQNFMAEEISDMPQNITEKIKSSYLEQDTLDLEKQILHAAQINDNIDEHSLIIEDSHDNQNHLDNFEQMEDLQNTIIENSEQSVEDNKDDQPEEIALTNVVKANNDLSKQVSKIIDDIYNNKVMEKSKSEENLFKIEGNGISPDTIGEPIVSDAINLNDYSQNSNESSQGETLSAQELLASLLKDSNFVVEPINTSPFKTRSMAEILVEQGNIKEAIEIYKDLYNEAKNNSSAIELTNLEMRINELESKVANIEIKDKTNLENIQNNEQEKTKSEDNISSTNTKNTQKAVDILNKLAMRLEAKIN